MHIVGGHPHHRKGRALLRSDSEHHKGGKILHLKDHQFGRPAIIVEKWVILQGIAFRSPR